MCLPLLVPSVVFHSNHHRNVEVHHCFGPTSKTPYLLTLLLPFTPLSVVLVPDWIPPRIGNDTSHRGVVVAERFLVPSSGGTPHTRVWGPGSVRPLHGHQERCPVVETVGRGPGTGEGSHVLR